MFLGESRRSVPIQAGPGEYSSGSVIDVVMRPIRARLEDDKIPKEERVIQGQIGQAVLTSLERYFTELAPPPEVLSLNSTLRERFSERTGELIGEYRSFIAWMVDQIPDDDPSIVSLS